jgi:hypothetical protein
MNTSTNRLAKNFTENFNIYKLENNKAELLFSGNTQDEAFQFVRMQEDVIWEGVKDSILKDENTTTRTLSKKNKADWGRLQAPYILDETSVSYWMKSANVNKEQLDSIKAELQHNRKFSKTGSKFIKKDEFRQAGSELEFFTRNPILWMQVNGIEIQYKSQEDKVIEIKELQTLSKEPRESKKRSVFGFAGNDFEEEELFSGSTSGGQINEWKSLLSRLQRN